MPLATVEEAIEDIRNGKMIILLMMKIGRTRVTYAVQQRRLPPR